MEHFVQAITVRWFNACAYYAIALSQGIRTLGYRVTVVGGHSTPAVQRARESQIDVFDCPVSTSTVLLSYMKLVKAYRRFALENNVTLVNAHNGYDHLLWAIALRGTGIPVIRTSGNRVPPKKHVFSRFLIRKKTAGIIASCSTIRGFYADGFGIESEKIPVIHGGVDSDFYVNRYLRGVLRKTVELPEDAFVFGILARFSPDKGHKFFFRAAEIVAKKYPHVWFLVAGWNAQFTEQDIRSMASEAGISNRVRFTGRYPDIRDLIGCVDVGVIASVGSETICRIAMEYMAMGVPVVATDTNAIPEVVRHGQSGLVVPAGNSEAMASAMEEMLESEEKTRTFGQCGRTIIKNEYSLTSFAAKTLKAYRNLARYE